MSPREGDETRKGRDYSQHIMSTPSNETFGVLLAISEAGTASVISICTASEAQGMADDDFRRRNPESDICPEAYEFHARDASGKYVLFATIAPL